MNTRSSRALLLVSLALTSTCLYAQGSGPSHEPARIADGDLDPTRNPAATPQLESKLHTPLPEQYIWTENDAVAADAGAGLTPHYFRRSFRLASVPPRSTLYLAGPRSATVFLNGKQLCKYQLDLDSPMGIRVRSCEIGAALRPGRNVLAIEAVRGPEIGSGADSRLSIQQTRGEVLAAKIVPAERGVDAAPLLISDAQWKVSTEPTDGWQSSTFDDRSWPAAGSLGGIESSIEFFQWNADAGMYSWPGYDGVSPFLARYHLAPATVSHVYAGSGQIGNAQALASGQKLQVTADPQDPPTLLLDFGREVVGRLELRSDSGRVADATVQYGESEPEALRDPYLGVDPVHVAPHGTAYGPKSAFRYALVRFTGGGAMRYRSIALEGIEYPVTYRGSFSSSDPALNRMWAVGAYTAHLCMQDDIWDAPKRDRGRWMGDLDVSGRTIEDAFGDHYLMDRTLDRLLGPAPVRRNVNGIAGYSAFWVTGEAEYYRTTGSMEQLASTHARLVQLLHFMETELDERDLYANKTHSWPFVDWSPELNGDDAESRRATEFEFYAAFRDGAYLLRQLHDAPNAALFEKRAEALKAAAQRYLLDPSGSFGTRWQTNAYAVLSGAADPSQYDSIWRNSLASVGHVKYNALIVSPYYNYYVISAMAKMGHRAEALAWIRQYWGGMLDEGATSFWEGYDPAWYKGPDFHASLQADNMSGYRVSLAHGWSSGVTPWLMEEVLGIHARGAGFSQVDIRPDLVDLKWAKGAEPTPRGLLGVSIRNSSTVIDLPAGVEAHVSVPVPRSDAPVLVNGKPQPGTPAEDGKRKVVLLNGAGRYSIESR